LKTTTLLKGVGVGLVAGAAITAAVMPIDKRRFMRSRAGRVVRSIGDAAHNITGNFS